jgi:hypothetical protein
MQPQRLLCIVALLLLAASLVLVAADPILFPDTEHKPGECPICSWASCLATSLLPAVVLLIGHLSVSRWVLHAPARVWYAAFSHRPFSARSPPALPLG